MLTKQRVLLFSSFILMVIISVVLYSCKPGTEVVGVEGSNSSNTSSNTTTTKSTISGQVVNSRTGVPIDSANVQLIGTSTSLSTLTSSQGKYSFTVNIQSNTNFTLYTSKSGYTLDTTGIYVTAGQDYNVSLIEMVEKGTGTVVSGEPVSIFLASQTASGIGVKESGSPETAGLTFEVQDSSGIPIDINHSVKVSFSLGAHPGGGEFISPSSVYTNSSGQATVNITSGTKAGVVQVLAEIDLDNNKIISKPVAISIYGGLPDQNHFSLQPSLSNVPGILFQSYPNFVTVFLGDKYGNPVRPNTAIYFTTTAGIIQGKALTDNDGVAHAYLTVAQPNTPSDPNLGAGYAVITASTANENYQTISETRDILFSSETQPITVTPTTFDIPNGGSQGFDYEIKDSNGNPISSANNIKVTVEGKDVGAQGDINFQMPDTQNKAWTKFHFVVYDAVDTLIENNAVTITIQSLGANGNISTQINGTCH